jgi:hypothetical protein
MIKNSLCFGHGCHGRNCQLRFNVPTGQFGFAEFAGCNTYQSEFFSDQLDPFGPMQSTLVWDTGIIKSLA